MIINIFSGIVYPNKTTWYANSNFQCSITERGGADLLRVLYSLWLKNFGQNLVSYLFGGVPISHDVLVKNKKTDIQMMIEKNLFTLSDSD